MSKLHGLRRKLVPRRVHTARMMAKLQAYEPDPRKLKDNFPAVFEAVFSPKQATREVFEPASAGTGGEA